MFEVAIDRPCRLMRVELSGFPDRSVFDADARDTAARAEQPHRAGGFDAFLVDRSDFPLQAQGIAELHGEPLIAARRRYGCRAALVMRSALSRLQATRVARPTHTELCDDADRALAALAGAGRATASC